MATIDLPISIDRPDISAAQTTYKAILSKPCLLEK
jgi:hypothetical protein